MDANPKTRARTLLTLLWRKYDTGGISMGRSYEAVLLEAAMDLLGPPDTDDVRRLETMDAGELLNETRSYLSAERARREGLTPNAELSGPRPLAAEGSRSNDVLGAKRPGKD